MIKLPNPCAAVSPQSSPGCRLRNIFDFHAFCLFANVSRTLKNCQEPSWTLVFMNFINSHYSDGLSGNHRDFQGLLWNDIDPHWGVPQLLRPCDRESKVQERPCLSTLWGLEHSREFSDGEMVRRRMKKLDQKYREFFSWKRGSVDF